MLCLSASGSSAPEADVWCPTPTPGSAIKRSLCPPRRRLAAVGWSRSGMGCLLVRLPR
jgi:hypothetical protein